jgi:hypothetical protein
MMAWKKKSCKCIAKSDVKQKWESCPVAWSGWVGFFCLQGRKMQEIVKGL